MRATNKVRNPQKHKQKHTFSRYLVGEDGQAEAGQGVAAYVAHADADNDKRVDGCADPVVDGLVALDADGKGQGLRQHAV